MYLRGPFASVLAVLVLAVSASAEPLSGLVAELRLLEGLEPAGGELCTDPELGEMYGVCLVWIDAGKGYHYFLMLRRREPWKVWRVPLEGNPRPEVLWRAAEGCDDDAVCA